MSSQLDSLSSSRGSALAIETLASLDLIRQMKGYLTFSPGFQMELVLTLSMLPWGRIWLSYESGKIILRPSMPDTR
jgi:hypothetical protein